MTTQRADVFVPITRIEKADGGRTRIVTGVAASDRLDYDGQRADYEWLKRELSTWYAPPSQGGQGGNMREDHKRGGVGKALTVEFDDDRRMVTVTSKAVDRDTIFKLDQGTLQGYSWGAKSVPGNPIRVQKAADGTETVCAGKIVEVSYVDAPCNADCYIELVKTVGKKGLQRTEQLGDLDYAGVTVIQAGQPNPTAILKGMLADIAKRDVSAAERERLGDQGHAIDTGQDHPSYPIKSEKDLRDAIDAYGRANPGDRAAVRRHIISEAKRLGRTDLIPDAWKSVEALVKAAPACGCCTDCGPTCGGDCCPECTMTKAAGPAAIVDGVKALEAGEPDTEYKAFLGKLAGTVTAWATEPGAAIDVASFRTLAALSKASAEPDLTKRRTFYSQANRASVEQAMQNLHQVLGLFMEGAPAADLDKGDSNGALSGQDAPDTDDRPGGPGTAPSDGVPDDGNLNLDPSLVQDGDPAIRQPDGQRDGRAQGEAGTHTWPPAGDSPGQGPGDQGKGEPPGGKGRGPFDGQQSPSKATKAERKLAKAKAELAELRKGATTGYPIAVNTTLATPAKARKDGADKALRAELAKTNAALAELASKSFSDPARPLDMQAAMQAIVRKHEKRVRKLVKRQAAPAPDHGPLAAAMDTLTKAITAAAAKPAADGTPQTIDSSLLLADLTRAAYEQTRNDLTDATERLARRVKRAERGLRKAAEADSRQLHKLVQDVNALGRLPHPAGPALAGPQEKNFPVNSTIERSLPAELQGEVQILLELSKATDQVVAEGARQNLRRLMERHGLTG